MRLCFAILFTAAWAAAADPQLLTLGLRAQSDFERVALVTEPNISDTGACIQSQAALLPVAPPAELALVHYRKGYCTLMGAIVTHDVPGFTQAAAEFDKAAAAQIPPRTSSALPVLASIARLEAGSETATLDQAEAALAQAVGQSSCTGTLMPADMCRTDLGIAHLWLGWIALHRGNLAAAAREFAAAPPSAWSDWVAGRQLFAERHYLQAARHYQAAIERWPSEEHRLLWPRADIGLALTDLGGAQLLAGDQAAAVASLDRAAKDDPNHARTFYLRARAEELAGHADAAEADYGRASRVAFASAQDLASGEAHLYRGILLYRRKDFPRAEAEFSSALNFDIPSNLRADAAAWRHLAAVASGSCGESREELARSLGVVSPYFPQNEAQAVMDACTTTAEVQPRPTAR